MSVFDRLVFFLLAALFVAFMLRGFIWATATRTRRQTMLDEHYRQLERDHER
jgi:hypothetical protein